MKNISKSKLYILAIPYPSEEKQAEYGALVEKLRFQIIKQKKALSEMNGLFSSLSQKAFKGELTSSTNIKEALSA